MTEKDVFIGNARATARLELAEYVRSNGLKDIRAKTIQIVQRHQQRVADFDAARLDMLAKHLRYSTLAAALDAYERRQMSDHDMQMHLEYFKAQRQQQQQRQGARR